MCMIKIYLHHNFFNMIDQDLSKRIKELRLKCTLTQEELAEATNLSLRTIQRIEAGETEPRGDTIKRLANALRVTSNDLMDLVEYEDKNFMVLLNLSALSFILFPLFGLIFPLIFWILRREKIKNIDEMGKRIINFQLTWCMLVFLSFIFLFTFPVWNYHGTNFDITGIATPLLYIYNFILIIVSTSLCYKGKKPFYKPAIRFLR